MKVTGPAAPDTTIAGPTETVLSGHALAAFTALGKRWSPHVLYLLGPRPARFTELQRAIPAISATSLNDRLRDLVDAGLVVRHTFPGPPLSSSYELTPTGQTIATHLARMVTDLPAGHG